MHLRIAILLCLPLLLFSTAAHAKIVFSSERNGVAGVYIMDDDGSNQTLLTEDEKLRPSASGWSPDGKKILFSRREQRHKKPVFFLMDPGGTNIQQLTEPGPHDRYIGKGSFSPDGTSIVFDTIVTIDNNQRHSITVLNIKTGKMKEISDLSANICDWSPDGKHIIFSKPVAVGGGDGTIWIMGADGHNPRPLIPVAEGGLVKHRWSPRWSPDSKQIVFTQDEYTWEKIPGGGIALVYHAHRYMICDRNGENIKKLQIPKDWEAYGIDWMDDGESVVFSAREGMPLGKPTPPGFVLPPCYIYKYHIPTGKRTRLTDDPGWDQRVDWISDDVLSVTPHGKKKITWGTLKKQKSE